ncbi:MAG: energy transducer TonB [Ignavibacteriae bacterium]|nr:MAG: energy transducer TonB [Ignavibacteriota bacterium]
MKAIAAAQAYGAAEIKSVYMRNLRRGLEYAIIVHIALFTVYFVLNYANNLNAENHKYGTEFGNYEPYKPDVPPPIEEPPEIQKTDIAPKSDVDLGVKTPEPVSSTQAEQMTIATQDELDKITSDPGKDTGNVKYVYNGNTGKNNTEIDDNNNIKIRKDPETIPKDKVYTGVEVEHMPEPVNFAQVKASLVYPEIAISSGIEGKVMVKVLVNAEGKVTKIASVTGPEVFHEEVREKVKNLEFTPGLLNDKAVSVWVNVPFSFKLENK